MTSLLASTYIGGSGAEHEVFNGSYSYGFNGSIAIDASGNVYITGHTRSSNFPTTAGAYDTTISAHCDIFISKFNSDLTTLLASTLFGAEYNDVFPSIAIDSSGNVYVVLATASRYIPIVPGAYDTTFNGGGSDIFVAKFNGALTSLLASTYLGGSGYENSSLTGYHLPIVIDSGGNIYVAGPTNSTNFPRTSGAYDTTFNGGYDTFVSKFNSNLTSLLGFTYLGGSGYEYDPSIAIDSGGNIYVTTYTSSTNFPITSGAYDTAHNGSFDVSISKFNSDLTSLVASTFLGGSGSDQYPSIVIDSGGNIYIAGHTNSTNFSTTSGAYDTTFNGGSNDVFVAKFNSNLTNLFAATYLGGSGNELYPSMAIDSSGNIYVVGQTSSSNFPTTPGAYDTTIGGDDIFITKLDNNLSYQSTTPPTVSSTNPTNNATNVAVNTAITATFSKVMDASTITTSTFTVNDGSSNIGGTVSYTGTTATFTPSGNLSYATTYTATITTGVKDTDGNNMAAPYVWSFTTGTALDTDPPIVTSTSPASGAVDVAINSPITATFNEIMDASTITTDTFIVNDGNSDISGTVSYTGTTATFIPSNDLTYSTTYTVTITTGVKDMAGNALALDYSWSFTTGQNPNNPPIANAGTDQSVYVGNTVTLDGSQSSDPDGDLLTYNWTFISKPGGSSATLSDSTLVNPTFIVDKAGTYEVSLIVNDGTVDSTENTVMISTINVKPIANAGADQSVYIGNVVTLDGSGSSDPDGDQLTYNWTFQSKPPDSTATLSNPTSSSPTFTIDKAGAYVVSLIVNDGALDSDPDTVTISNINVAPVADAGMDQAITVIGTTVQLDGTQSYDPDGDPITYQWAFTSIPGGSTASLANADTATPTFTADVHGEYIVQLVVNDGSIPSSPDTVIVSFTNIKPVANAGTSQSAVVGDTVTINGSGSTDGNGDYLTYQWSFSSVPGGSLASIVSPTAMITTFVPDKAGTYVIQLVVNDGIVDSDPNTVQVQVIDVQTAAIQAIQDCEQVIASLSSGVFKNANMQNTMINKLNAVIANIEAGNYEDALGQLQNDILGKTDGCANSGSPDKNDWLKDCAAQGAVYSYIQHAIMVVEGLIASN